MCGRFTYGVDQEEMKDYLFQSFKIDDFDFSSYKPRYNVAPGQNILSIINDGNKNRAGYIKWGFITNFSKDSFNVINAKAETLDLKPSFKESFVSKRCAIIADGFYEWKKTNNKKMPIRFQLENKEIFPMAGLWNSITKEDGSKIFTALIITTSANSLVSEIHERMPVILTDESKSIWLNSKIDDLAKLKGLLLPYDSKKMIFYPVSSKVNNAYYDDAIVTNSF